MRCVQKPAPIPALACQTWFSVLRAAQKAAYVMQASYMMVRRVSKRLNVAAMTGGKLTRYNKPTLFCSELTFDGKISVKHNFCFDLLLAW